MTEELKTIDTVDTSPFKKLIMTIGELPTSFVDSMTYYECLAWLVDYIQNTVIPAVNNNADALSELQTAFVTLKNYVDNYFENLDVQQEINNKIDEMVESGQFQTILDAYVDPQLNELNNNLTNSINTEVENRTNADANLQAQISTLASGSPLVASSTSEMTDTTKVYVNTTDGKWYYYDGDSWEIGGTYQSTGIGDGTINYTMFDETTAKLINGRIPTYTTTDNYYIATNGSIYSANNYCYTSNIELKAGETIVFYGNGTSSVAMLSEYVNDAYKKLVDFDTEGFYFYTAERDMSVAISSRKSDLDKVSIFTIFDKNLETDYLSARNIKYDTSITDNSYVHYQTGIVYTHNSYKATDYIEVIPDSVIEITSEPKLVNTASSAGCAFYDKDHTFISGVQYTTDSSLEVTVPSNAVYARFTMWKNATYFNIYYQNVFKAILGSVSGRVEPTPFFDISVFTNIAVCGDSYASGCFGEDSSATRAPEHYSMSWCAMLQRKYGFDLANYSYGGVSTRSFINGDSHDDYLNTLLNDDPHELYVLALERNDKTIYVSDSTYLGSINDITDHTLGNYPDTFYGNYATIIESIQNHAPTGKLVMFIGDFLPTDSQGTQMNEAMKNIAIHYGIPYLEQLSDPYINSQSYRRNRPAGGHPSAIQYNGLSLVFERLMAQAFIDYPDYFKYIVPTEE